MGKQENRAFDYSRWPNWIDPKKAAAERAAAQVWELSEREREIVKSLGEKAVLLSGE